jgi:two-component sensor histidine kinase
VIFVVRGALEDQARTLDRVQQTTRALVAAVDGRFQTRIALLQGLASSTPLEQGDLQQFRRRAETVLQSLPAGAEIILFDATGQELLNTSVPAGKPLPFRANMRAVKEVFATGRPFVSDLFRDALANRLTVSVDVPVFDGGQVRYGLGLNIFREEFHALVTEQRIPPSWFLGLVDRNGILAARLPLPERYVGTPAAPLLQDAIKGASEGHVETPTLEGVAVVSTWSRSATTGWAMALAVPKRALYAPLYQNLIFLLTSGFAAAVIGGILAHRLGSSISSRLVVLERRASGLTTDRERPALPPGIREIDNVDQELRAAADTIRDQQQHQHMLMAELDHRVKNILAIVQALVSKTLGRSEQTTAIAGRIRALADAHSMLTRMQGRGAPLSELIETTLGVHMGSKQVMLSGPPVVLNARATQAMALALHELATNAVKYGALSNSTGRIEITWSIADGRQPRFFLTWAESGGPPVSPPDRQGFGTMLIEKNLPSTLEGAVVREFRSTGMICRIEAPLGEVVSESDSSIKAQASTARDQSTTLPQGKHLLLVEDEPLVAAEVTSLLTEAGCQVTWASRIPEALELISRERFDAAVLDVNVHGRRIFPVSEALAAGNVPFVFVTGYEDPRIWPEQFRGHRRISKPVKGTVLYGALGELLDGQEKIEISQGQKQRSRPPDPEQVRQRD